MAAYIWSALNDNDILAFNPLPGGDTLTFDGGISAADVHVDGEDTTTVFTVGTKTVTLNTNPLTITTANVTFANGSLLLVGDNTTGVVNDDSANNLTGGTGNDQLIGLGGDDSLLGGDGNDLFTIFSSDVGGYGNDTLNGGAGSDTIDYRDADNGVIVQIGSAQSGTGGDGTPGSTLTLISIENVIGTEFNDSITGNNSANHIEGDSGNDTLTGGGTTDAANDTLIGDSGDDRLIQTLGNDSILGGSGTDTLSFNSTISGGVNVNLAAGTSAATGSSAVISGIELVFGNAGDDSFTGGDASHAPSGGANSVLEIFRGNGGNDTINGAEGDGWLTAADYANDTPGVTATLGTSNNSGFATGINAGNDVLLNVDQVRGGSGADLLVGGSYARVSSGTFSERFRGNAGNDTIDGQGADTTLGGIGVNDVVDYANSVAPILVNLGAVGLLGPGGYGLVAAGTARDGTDNLGGGGGTDTLLSIDVIVGSAFNDTIVGAAGEGVNFRFEGRAGSDSLVGASGTNNETDHSADTGPVIVNLGDTDLIGTPFGTIAARTARDGFGDTDQLVNINWARGSSQGDRLVGGSYQLERLMGGAGDDTLDGGDISGVNYATYQADGAGVTAFVENGMGNATDGWGDVDELVNINGLWGSNFNDSLTGGLGDQWLRGRGGNDTIDGGAGIDTVNYNDPSWQGVTVDLSQDTARDGWGSIWQRGDGTLSLFEGGELAATLTQIVDPGNPIVGSWVLDESGGTVVVTLLSNGTYFIAEDGDSVAEPGGQDGMERGTYTWDAGTGEFSFVTQVDTNGEWGLSHSAVDSVIIQGDSLIADDGGELVTFRRAADGPLMGGWHLTDAGEAQSSGVITFLSDGRYVMAEDGDPIADPAGQDGMELGTFTWDPSTGTFSHTTLVDTTNEWGLSHSPNLNALFINGGVDTLFNIENVEGSMFGDHITGDVGANVLNGGDGDDTLNGGEGDDTLDGGEGTDTVSYANDAAGVTIEMEFATATDGSGDTDTLINIQNALGSAHDDEITGDSFNNVLDGGGGNDSLRSGGGNDTLIGGDGRQDRVFIGGAVDPIVVTMGNETIDGSITGGDGGSLTLRGVEAVVGTAFADTFNANENIQVNGLRTDIVQRFEGGAGNDSLAAGLNGGWQFGITIIAEYRNDPGGIIVNLDQQNGEDLVVGAEIIEAGTARDGYGNVDQLQTESFGPNLAIVVDGIVGSMHADYIQGGAFANSVGGNSKQIFEGLAGDDTIIGGFDHGGAWVSYESAGPGVFVNLSGNALDLGPDPDDGLDMLEAHSARDGYGDTDTLQEIDRARGSMHNDTFFGGSDDEEHYEGMGGHDSINGGVHFDNVYYSHAEEGVLVHLGATLTHGIARALDGTDESGTIGEDTLVEIESAHGSDFDDSIVGGGDGAQADEFEEFEPWEGQLFVGWEELEGYAGNDTINGGDGAAGPANPRDIALYRDSPGSVIVNLGNGTVGGIGPDRASDGFGDIDHLIDIVGAEGSRFDDTLIGDEGDNYFVGRQGNDSIIGGAGNDWISYDFGNRVFINLNQTTAIEFQGGPGGFLWVDTISGFENVVGSSGDDSIVGSSATANLLAGFEGNDSMSGGDGTAGGGTNDSLYGGEDNDILTQTRGNDYIDGGEGTGDRLQFFGFEYGGTTAVRVDLGAGTSDGNRALAGHDGAVTNVEIVFGTAGHDILIGGSEARSFSDTFLEIFRGQGGNDTIDGAGSSGNVGRGWVDRVEYSSSITGAVNVNLETGVAQDGQGGIDTLKNINWVVGSSNDDVLKGGNKANDFFERFEGRAGSDTLDGGSGQDDASYISSPSAVYVDLGSGIAFDGWGSTDALFNIERARGSNFNDTLIGSNRLDVIEMFIGEGGDDYIDGGAGIDFVTWRTLDIEDGGVNIVLGDDTVNDGIENDLGQEGVDTLVNIEGFDGSAADDTVTGADGGDWWFRGRGGSDVLIGGNGINGVDTADYSTDHFGVIVNMGGANVVVNMGGGNETVLGGTARDGFGGIFEAEGIDTLTNIENVLGSIEADHITGGAGDNLLDGNLGNDTINGGDGADTLIGGAGNDSLVGGLGDDTLDGGAGNDVMAGGDGDDVFADASGNDTLNGGAGADTFFVNYKSGTISVNVADADVSDDLFVVSPDAIGSVYRVTGFAPGEDHIDVGALLDTSAVDGFYSGQDPIAGGFLRFQSAGGDAVLQWDRTGNANGAQWVTVMTLAGLGGAGLGTSAFLGFQAGGADVDSLTGGTGDDLMLGLGGNDVLIAGDGDDQLFGGTGVDTMQGGEGNDVYHVDSLLDVVEDVANPISLVLPGGTGAGAAGTSNIGDTIIAAINYSLNREEVQNIEHLQLFGKAARGEGNALSNLVRGNLGNDSLTGFGGADTLDGGAGADTMVGGMGNDVYVVDSAGDKVTELGGEGTDDVLLSSVTRKLDLNVEHLVLTGRASIIGTGNKQNNSITGNIGKNLLVGDVGDDTLNGGAGADTMNGGKGNDYYVVDAGGKAADIIVNETGGNDTIESSVTRLLEASVENIILTGNRAIDATGNAGANRLIGNINDNDLNGGDGADTLVGGSGNDLLNGGIGADVDSLVGGLGNDTYVVVDNVVDQIVEAEDEGIDTVQATVTIATLAENVENIVLGRIGKVHPNINATGNGLDNTITGNGGSNTLNGGDGDDTVDGAGGVDVLRGGAGDDVLVWDAADDSIEGGGNSVDGGDVLLVLGAAQDIVLSEENIAGIEVVKLTGSGNNKLTVTSADVLAMSTTDTLLVEGNDGDEVHFDDPSGWHEGTTSVDGVSYHVFTKNGATLLIATAIDTTGLG